MDLRAIDPIHVGACTSQSGDGVIDDQAGRVIFAAVMSLLNAVEYSTMAPSNEMNLVWIGVLCLVCVGENTKHDMIFCITLCRLGLVTIDRRDLWSTLLAFTSTTTLCISTCNT